MAEDVPFKISLYAKSDVGVVRPGNEDHFLVLNLSTAETWKPGSEGGGIPEKLSPGALE